MLSSAYPVAGDIILVTSNPDHYLEHTSIDPPILCLLSPLYGAFLSGFWLRHRRGSPRTRLPARHQSVCRQSIAERKLAADYLSNGAIAGHLRAEHWATVCRHLLGAYVGH